MYLLCTQCVHIVKLDTSYLIQKQDTVNKTTKHIQLHAFACTS